VGIWQQLDHRASWTEERLHHSVLCLSYIEHFGILVHLLDHSDLHLKKIEAGKCTVNCSVDPSLIVCTRGSHLRYICIDRFEGEGMIRFQQTLIDEFQGSISEVQEFLDLYVQCKWNISWLCCCTSTGKICTIAVIGTQRLQKWAQIADVQAFTWTQFRPNSILARRITISSINQCFSDT
jgi:hypothetical protein